MRKMFVAVAMGAILLSAATAQAQLLYSFESPAVNPDGFGPNGGGVTITQDTIGATNGTHSLKYSVVAGATFVGALSGNVPAALNNPPGVESILYDLTINQGDAFAGAFDVMGVTIFGASQPSFPGGQQFGLQAQFSSLTHIEGKAAGSYPNQALALVGGTNPLTFATGQTFNQIFGSGANQLIPTGFQFFINKSNDAPSTIYIDNVRIGSVPEPASLGLISMGAVVFGFVSRRRRS